MDERQLGDQIKDMLESASTGPAGIVQKASILREADRLIKMLSEGTRRSHLKQKRQKIQHALVARFSSLCEHRS